MKGAVRRLLTCGTMAIALNHATYARADVVRVFVVAGQSNAVGYGADAFQPPANLQTPQIDIRFWFEDGVAPVPAQFAAGDAYANCDSSTSPPVLNFAHFS